MKDQVFLNVSIVESGSIELPNIVDRLNRDIINVKSDYMSILIGVNDIWVDIWFTDGTSINLYEQLYDCVVKENLVASYSLKIVIMETFVLR